MNVAKSTKKPKYDKKVYLKLPKANLILYGIYLVSDKKGETCTFEMLVKECFDNFHEVFSFKRFPEWPDSSKFDRDLRKLREEGLIVGRVDNHFALTDFGKEKALNVEALLMGKRRQSRTSRKPAISARSVHERIINYLKQSPQYNAFINSGPHGFSMSEQEFRNMLRCTLETPERVLRQNLQYYKNIAKEYDDKDLMDFLLFCERKFIKEGNKNE